MDNHRLWNKLPLDVRCISSYKALKARLKKEQTKEIPNYYHHGKRKPNVLHTKLRLGCSDLNLDKFNIGVHPNNLCHCGEIESAKHYLLECGSNLVSKVKMLDTITDILTSNNRGDDITIDLLLKGSITLSDRDNKKIFDAVQLFILESKRFA